MSACLLTDDHSFDLATRIADLLNVPLYRLQTVQFADGEFEVSLQEDLALYDQVVFLHMTAKPVQDRFMHLLLSLKELKKKGAEHITLVAPYFPYARQDKPVDGMSVAHFLMMLLRQAGADRLVTLELHNPATAECAPLSVINIRPYTFLATAIQEHIPFEDLTVISPDKGSFERAQTVAQASGAELMLFEKERYDVNKTRIIGMQGTCKTMNGLIVDDIIDTGSTLVNIAQALQDELGACRLSVLAVHPVLSGNAVNRLEQFPFERIYVSNSIALPKNLSERYVVIDIAPLIAERIRASNSIV